MSNQSIIEHKANMYYVEFREDYLLVARNCTFKKTTPKTGKPSKASCYCKALILAILEHWTNDKRGKGGTLHVYMTYQQWCDAMYGMFGRNVVIDSLDELIGEGLISREPYKMFTRDTFQYLLNYTEVNRRIQALPSRDPMMTQPQVDPFTSKRDAFTSKPVAFTSKPDALISKSVAFTSNHNIDSTYIPLETNKEENTLPAVAPSPTASSHDEDAHALLSSEQKERMTQDDAHARPVVPTLPPTAHGPSPAQLPAGNAAGHEASEPGMDTPSLIATGAGTTQPAKEKAARKPRAPKPPVDESLQIRIERVYAFFDALGQEVTEDSDYHYRHSKKASEAIVEWLKSSPTEAILREVYLKLWNTPADQRTGFCWRDNMSIVAVLGQYDRMALAIKAKKKAAQRANLSVVLVAPEPEIDDYDVHYPTVEEIRAKHEKQMARRRA